MEKKIIAKNQNAKKEIKKEIPAKKESLQKINLAEFKNELSKIELKKKDAKESFYKYPDGWNKETINSEDGKKWRNNKRNALKSICNNILYYAKGDNLELLQNEIKKFDAFYKEFYIKNDYSISSLSQSKDESKIKDISLSLSIIRKIKG